MTFDQWLDAMGRESRGVAEKRARVEKRGGLPWLAYRAVSYVAYRLMGRQT